YAGLSTRLHCGPGVGNTSPLRSRISMIGVEAQCTPRLAIVAYASAISSGDTSEIPRVDEGTRSLFGSPRSGFRRTPISRASSHGPHRPVIFSSWTKNVFTDSWVPEYMSMVPLSVELWNTCVSCDGYMPVHVR